MEMAKKCDKCGHNNRLTYSYCVKCGKLLPGMYEKEVVRKDSYVDKDEFIKIAKERNEFSRQVASLQNEVNKLRQNQHTAPTGSRIITDKEYNDLLSDSKTLKTYRSNGYAPWGKRLISNSEYDRLSRNWIKRLGDDFESWMDKYWWIILVFVGLVVACIYIVKSCGNDAKKITESIEIVKDRNTGKFGIYDNKTNALVTPYEYDSISHRRGNDYQGVYRNYFYLYKNGKIGVADSTGKTSINCELDATEGAYNGVIILQKGDKQGLMDCYGHQIIPCEYQYVLWQRKPNTTFECPGTYVGNIIPVKSGNNTGWELYDRSGHKIRGQHYEIVMQTGDPHTIKVRDKIRVTNASYYKLLYGTVDESGHDIIPCKYYSMSRFSNDRAWVKEYYNDSWTLITPKGEKVMSLSKSYIPSVFSEGLAYISENKKIGFCDVNGKFVIPMNFEKANDSYPTFYGGKAKVIYNGRIGFVDKKGIFTPEQK